jgi:hypothetical protein
MNTKEGMLSKSSKIGFIFEETNENIKPAVLSQRDIRSKNRAMTVQVNKVEGASSIETNFLSTQTT